ncbi:MAG: phosphoglycerate dehydrogenase [bacterium]
MKVLITTTSFQDNPGRHHEMLAAQGYEIVRGRGPLDESRMLELVEGINGMICGDDEITRAVILKALPSMKVISKYGIGLDRIDLDAATELKVPVCFTPGVNDVTVAEHVFGLMICLARNITQENELVKSGRWKRLAGRELHGKTLGIMGLGRIGRQVAMRAKAFGMRVLAYDIHWDERFASEWKIEKCPAPHELLNRCDVLTLHMNLTPENRNFLNRETLALMKPSAFIINCARGQLVSSADLAEALRNKKIAGYAADVLEKEPPDPDDPLLRLDNAIFTPHIGSRTFESVERQAAMAAENLIRVLSGAEPLAQANRL